MSNQPKSINVWLITTVILGLALAWMAFGGGLSKNLPDGKGGNNPTISAEKAGTDLLVFLNQVYGSTVGEIKSKNVIAQNGLYKVEVEFPQGQTTATSSLYLTMDGKLFVPQVIDVEELKAQSEEAKQQNPAATTEIPKNDKPTVELFTMSYCPYGNQAEAGMIPVAKLLSKQVDIVPHYIFYANYQGGGSTYCIDKDSKYCSMHGVKEAQQDIRELCIYKYNKDKYWDYIDKVNTQCTVSNIDTCWSQPAKDLGVNTSKISQCETSEGEKLAAAEVALTDKYQVSGSPTLIINGVKFDGQRTADAYKTGICGAFNTQPAECSQTLDSNAAATTGSCN